jgi:hypothetical protein
VNVQLAPAQLLGLGQALALNLLLQLRGGTALGLHVLFAVPAWYLIVQHGLAVDMRELDQARDHWRWRGRDRPAFAIAPQAGQALLHGVTQPPPLGRVIHDAPSPANGSFRSLADSMEAGSRPNWSGPFKGVPGSGSW